ncbi:MAG: hypothetical protein AVDCRST_MAG18-3387, partial [uncultured Thermomicrobiales bacterium]
AGYERVLAAAAAVSRGWSAILRPSAGATDHLTRPQPFPGASDPPDADLPPERCLGDGPRRAPRPLATVPPLGRDRLPIVRRRGLDAVPHPGAVHRAAPLADAGGVAAFPQPLHPHAGDQSDRPDDLDRAQAGRGARDRRLPRRVAAAERGDHLSAGGADHALRGSPGGPRRPARCRPGHGGRDAAGGGQLPAPAGPDGAARRPRRAGGERTDRRGGGAGDHRPAPLGRARRPRGDRPGRAPLPGAVARRGWGRYGDAAV